MGRGRAKAKQTRVARDLKYRDVGTDLTQLANELRKTGNGPGANGNAVDKAPSDAEPDEYADRYGDDEEDYDGKDDGGSHRSHHREG
jgi:Protein of unknown function (DUF3073)